ncbi:MAG: hypothetical protein EBU75_09150 [Betaproteobacteria bacterium]|nr:hypothetical protein [Betaproteobacteria bacterium]
MKKTSSYYLCRLASVFLFCLYFSAAASAQGLDQQWQRQNNSQGNRADELDKICKYFASGKAVGGFEGERF